MEFPILKKDTDINKNIYYDVLRSFFQICCFSPFPSPVTKTFIIKTLARSLSLSLLKVYFRILKRKCAKDSVAPRFSFIPFMNNYRLYIIARFKCDCIKCFLEGKINIFSHETLLLFARRGQTNFQCLKINLKLKRIQPAKHYKWNASY